MSAALVRLGHVIEVDFDGSKIRRDGNYLHATDMWRAGGEDPSKEPARWEKLAGTREYLSALGSEDGSPPPILRISGNPRSGDGGGKWFDRLVAVEYARYLKPSFAVWVNRIFLDVTEGRGELVRPAQHDPLLVEVVESNRIAREALAQFGGLLGTFGQKVGELGEKVADLDAKLDDLSAKFDQGRRKNFGVAIVARWQRVASNLFGGRCPCCASRRITSAGGTLLRDEVEFDHIDGHNWRNSALDGWPICKPCHERLSRDASFRDEQHVERMVWKKRVRSTMPKPAEQMDMLRPVRRRSA